MPLAARLGDMHTCPRTTGSVPHVGGPVIQGSSTVLVGYQPAARKGDNATCVGPPDSINQGSTTVLIDNKAAARMGDSTKHSGKVVLGGRQDKAKAKRFRVAVAGLLDDAIEDFELLIVQGLVNRTALNLTKLLRQIGRD